MPTDYLLDTNSVTALASGNASATGHLSRVGTADGVYTCFVVVGEWEYGILNAQGQRRQQQIRSVGEPLFAALTGVWQSTPAIALQYGVLQAQLRATGQMIPTNDIWIAATAVVYSATVVTTDPHFGRIANLMVVDWTRP